LLLHATKERFDTQLVERSHLHVREGAQDEPESHAQDRNHLVECAQVKDHPVEAPLRRNVETTPVVLHRPVRACRVVVDRERISALAAVYEHCGREVPLAE
jgi:hypothetical protein